MFNHALHPHESAITGNATIQAIRGLHREMGVYIENRTMRVFHKLLAVDKDRKHFYDLRTNAIESAHTGSGLFCKN